VTQSVDSIEKHGAIEKCSDFQPQNCVFDFVNLRERLEAGVQAAFDIVVLTTRGVRFLSGSITLRRQTRQTSKWAFSSSVKSMPSLAKARIAKEMNVTFRHRKIDTITRAVFREYLLHYLPPVS